MATDFVTRQDVKILLGFKNDDSNDALIDAIIPPICESLRRQCGLNFDQRAYTEVRNGNGRSAIFVLQPPVATSPAPSVTENGTSLVVATGYSTSADVIVDPNSGKFYRVQGPTPVPSFPGYMQQPGAWCRGVQNVTLGYTGGYATANLPAHLLLLTKYMVGAFWKQLDRKDLDVSSKNVGQASVQLLQDLPDRYKKLLDLLTRPMVPEI